ncbi:MAG: hypothetical protein PHO76_09135 [Methylotenera sp.]|nr:hypothetical protein [Methylotenera sp.]MDD4925925.1 hypothetical protein [Methylotenera sp.]
MRPLLFKFKYLNSKITPSESVKIKPMLQRLTIHIALVFLFAFTQMGVATHEISHLTNSAKHGQQDQNPQSKHTPAEQCEQCISYAKVASGLQLSAFVVPAISADSTQIANDYFSVQSYPTTAYTARGPPQKLNI